MKKPSDAISALQEVTQMFTKKYDQASVEMRMAEHQLISVATEELERGEKDTGSWGKALMDAKGNREAAEGLYIKHRVESLKDELQAELLFQQQARLLAIREKEVQAEVERTEKASEYVVKYPDEAIEEIIRVFNVGRINDLMPLMNIDVKAVGEKYFYYILGSEQQHESLKEAVLEYISTNGFNKPF